MGTRRQQSIALRVRIGSSPRVWGQDSDILTKDGATGIIPTRMGTRVIKKASCVSLWDHPHAYGDKSGRHTKMLRHSGSSPRVWGQDNVYDRHNGTVRIIPTRVGTRILKAVAEDES